MGRVVRTALVEVAAAVQVIVLSSPGRWAVLEVARVVAGGVSAQEALAEERASE